MSASPTTTFTNANAPAYDTYSGINHGRHDHCCVTYGGQFTNLSLAEFATTAPPRLELQNNITSEVIGHCRIGMDSSISAIVANHFHDMDYMACLWNNTDKRRGPNWFAWAGTSRSGNVIGAMTSVQTFMTGGTATPSTWAVPTGLPYDVSVVDFYSGIYLDRMASSCELVEGTGAQMSLETFNATVPKGFYLRSNISSASVGHCRVASIQTILLAQYLISPSGADYDYWDTDRWYIVASTDVNGTIMGFTENGIHPWRSFGSAAGAASPTGATLSASSSGTSSPTSSTTSSATSSLGRVRLGLVSLVAMAAAAVVTF